MREWTSVGSIRFVIAIGVPKGSRVERSGGMSRPFGGDSLTQCYTKYVD